jgi:siroheme synthase-like protein
MTYPVGLVIRDRRCLVVGGGRIASRKISGLLDAGARVTVVSPTMSRSIVDLSLCETGRLTLVRRRFVFDDLDEVFLVISATENAMTNRSVCVEAQKRSILCCSVNTPEDSSFHCMATMKRENLIIGISSGGTDPTAAKRMKVRISEALE